MVPFVLRRMGIFARKDRLLLQLKHLAIMIAFCSVGPLAYENRAFAQAKKTEAQVDKPLDGDERSRVAELKEGVEDGVRKLLGRHIPAEEFQVDAVVTPKKMTPKKRRPYLPDPSPARIPKGASLDELRPFIARMQIKIYLTARFDKKAINNIRTLLNSKIGMDESAGDKIEFASLGIAVAKPSSDLERELLSAEAKLRAAEQSIKSTEKERDEAKQQYIAAKSELDSASRREQNKGPSSADQQHAEGFWPRHGVTIGLGGALTLALLFLGLFFVAGVRGLGRQFKEGATAIAQAMESGQKSSSQEIAIALPPIAPAAIASGGELRDSNSIRNSTSIPLQALHTRLQELHDELLSRFNDMTEVITLRHVDSMLMTPSQIAKAVSTMELLGRDKANELFHRLSPSAQEIIHTFLREGFYDRPKGELMLEAGEELMTKLLAEGFDQGVIQPNKKLASRIIKLGNQDLATVVSLAHDSALPRFFRCLEAPKIASVIEILKTKDKRSFDRAVACLHKIGKSESMEQLDDDLAKTLDSVIDKIKDDSERPYLKFYQAIVESADEGLADELIAGFGTSKRIKDYLDENVITLGTFFKLKPELQAELLERLSNKDIAAIVVGLSAEQSQQIMAALTDRRRELINDETAIFQSGENRNANASALKAKALLIDKMKTLKSQGTLELSSSDAANGPSDVANVEPLNRAS